MLDTWKVLGRAVQPAIETRNGPAVSRRLIRRADVFISSSCREELTPPARVLC